MIKIMSITQINFREMRLQRWLLMDQSHLPAKSQTLMNSILRVVPRFLLRQLQKRWMLFCLPRCLNRTSRYLRLLPMLYLEMQIIPTWIKSLLINLTLYLRNDSQILSRLRLPRFHHFHSNCECQKDENKEAWSPLYNVCVHVNIKYLLIIYNHKHFSFYFSFQVAHFLPVPSLP